MGSSIGPIPLPDRGGQASGLFTFDDPEINLGKYQWPYFAVSGAEAGPTFILTAGIHAAEYTGILAAIRLGRGLRPETLRGTIIIIPVLNRPGFYERSIYINPVDGENLNRIFPGRPDGTWSERFAHHLLNDIIVHADYTMDLHAGDMIEDLQPFVIFSQTGNTQVDARTRQMVDSYGVRWATCAVPSGERPGMLYAAAAERGVPAFIAESGRCGLVEEDAITRHTDGVRNIWRTLGLLVDAPPLAVTPPTVLNRFEWLRSTHEGIFECAVRVNDPVQTGQSLGRMIDLVGNPLAEVTSPADGVVLFTVTSPAIKRDGLLLGVGVP
ncbi:MAG TPA: succinylglutamate desuccinylase/aspartoacylase family protein [Chloroflexota bacterium]|nr:succinylglutamate desuccinylase/aspartoacylase family protein [Chloroflexota bacterium]